MEFAELIQTPKVDGVVLHTALTRPVDVALCLTGHHLILSARREGIEELWILHRNIDVVERKPNGFLGGSLIIKCKDFRIIQLDINNFDEFNNVANSLERLSSLEDITLFYPFFYRPMYTVLEDGWSAFRPESEFSRLLVPGAADDWRITYVNRDFSVCGSYPTAVVVPKSVDDETLQAAAKFRQGGRFPVFSYKHESGSVLMRASQPLAGPGTKRCREDEKLLNAVLAQGNKRGYIVDTRSQSLAQTAKARGGGVEPEAHYPQWRRVHKPIDRHAGLLDSLAKLVDACNDTNSSSDRWLSRLDSSGWLSHVKDSLNCACLVAQCLDQEGASVLVHGSEGLDSTLLVSSLAQIILNPDCRTVRGLEALVEREWLQAGHPFFMRHQRGSYGGGSSGGSGSGGRGSNKGQQAPTFLLFLDCVAQIHAQFPCSFEFSTSLLILLFEHAYSSQFGTFLGNCEADRERLQLSSRTVSLWSHLNRPEILSSLLNPLYEPNSRVIWPSVAPMSLVLWSDLFLRYSAASGSGLAVRNKSAFAAVKALCANDHELRSKAAKLRRQLVELEKEAMESGLLLPPATGLDISEEILAETVSP